MKIIKWLIGFPLLSVFAYMEYATVFGLFGALVCWDISVLFDLWKFWIKIDYPIGRGLIWILSTGTSFYFIEG